MFIYNRTTNISEESHDRWLDWMQKTHIPSMLATGKFNNVKLVQVLIKEEMGGITYSEQYTCESVEKLKDFYTEDKFKLEKEASRLFKGHFVSFETELKVIQEFKVKR